MRIKNPFGRLACMCIETGERFYSRQGETMTKEINVYNKRKRAIKCITNKFDYLGDGELFYEDRLQVGKIYTMIDCKR